MNESERNYFAPPIIDATIELRFQNSLKQADRERVSKKFAKRYPLVEQRTVQQIMVNVQTTGIATQATVQEHLTRRRSTDNAAVVQVGDFVFDVATAAPYGGWHELFDRFVEDWETAKRIWRYRPIQRIGLRYINRIDLEPNEKDVVEYENYLNLRINLPETFPPITGYELGFQSDLEHIKCGIRVQSGTVPPAVPGKMSFSLDIDVWRQVDVPQKDEDVLRLLGEMRKAKNELFETFIKDEARRLFDAK
jgi:uncharacterized protein (TIGR04255 family)